MDEDDNEISYVPSRGARLSAPQLQAQLSRMTDRTRLRRFRELTLQARGAWQQVVRIEDPRDTRVSRK